jgi:hypothetical protein
VTPGRGHRWLLIRRTPRTGELAFTQLRPAPGSAGQDRAHTYNEKFTIWLQKVDGTTATISNL